MKEDMSLIGTFSYINMRTTSSLKEGLLGNDAVLCTKYLTDWGICAKLLLLNPTSKDIAYLRNLGGGLCFDPIDIDSRDSLSVSTCTEAVNGIRNWSFSRNYKPNATLPLINSRLVYVDWYTELNTYLMDNINKFVNNEILYINFSQSSEYDLPLKIPNARRIIIQVSSGHRPYGESVRFGQFIRNVYSADVIVTLGRSGVLLFQRSDEGYYALTPPSIFPNKHKIFGAGATLSASVIYYLSDTSHSLDEIVLHAMGKTAELIKESSRDFN